MGHYLAFAVTDNRLRRLVSPPATAFLMHPVVKDELEYVDVYCWGDPSRKSGGRVWRRFPIVHKWSGIATILLTNDTITEAVLRRHLDACGSINGMGRWRPQTSGQFGRFKVIDFTWHGEARFISNAA